EAQLLPLPLSESLARGCLGASQADPPSTQGSKAEQLEAPPATSASEGLGPRRHKDRARPLGAYPRGCWKWQHRRAALAGTLRESGVAEQPQSLEISPGINPHASVLRPGHLLLAQLDAFVGDDSDAFCGARVSYRLGQALHPGLDGVTHFGVGQRWGHPTVRTGRQGHGDHGRVADEADQEQLHPTAGWSRQGPIALLETAHRYAAATFIEKGEDLRAPRPDPPGKALVVHLKRSVGEERTLAVSHCG